MTAKIYIASKDAPLHLFNKQHLYLVYDADGDPTTTGDQEVIRGGGFPGDIEIEYAEELSESADNFELGEDYIDRNYTELDLGVQTVNDVWTNMLAAAAALGTLDGQLVTTPIGYNAFGPNSNSVTATIMYRAGLDIAEQHPLEGGSGDPIYLSKFTGANAYLGTDANDTWGIALNYAKTVVDQGGDDTYTLDASIAPGGVLTILEVAESASDNELVLENVDEGDVSVFKTRDGTLVVIANDKIVAWVPDQYTGDYPRLNNIHIVPTVGDPVDIVLDDPATIPIWDPSALPDDFVPDWLQDFVEKWVEAFSVGSPLVLDLDNDGVELTEFDAETTTSFFDIDADGFAEQTAWVDADDGLLARDINENGLIDDVSELFGSPSVDGFALLQVLDTNNDHVIDQYDEAWEELRVWQDANGDAVTQDGELLTLASLDIISFDLAGVVASTSTISGNPISHTSTYTIDGVGTRTIADVWFVHSDVNTVYNEEYERDSRTLFLPNLRGFGELPDLHIAMSGDEDLLDLVQQFVLDWNFERFTDSGSLDDDIREILFTWAGVDELDPGSRNGDAQQMGFMEKLTAKDYVQFNGTSNPMNYGAAFLLQEVWPRAYLYLKAQLIAQAGGAALFDTGTLSYNAWTGTLEGNMDVLEAVVGDLEGIADGLGSNEAAFWCEVIEFLAFTKGLANLTGTEEGWFDASIDATTDFATLDELAPYAVPTWTGVSAVGSPDDDVINGTGGPDTLDGGAGNDEVYGGAANDFLEGGTGNDLIDGGGDDDELYGEAGDDELYGTTGVDELYGGDGNDILDGGDGNDLLYGGAGGNVVYGGAGDDTYFYEGGDDIYDETGSSGTDEVIMLPDGIELNDLTFTRINGGYSLLIQVGDLGTIETPFFDQYASPHSSYRIEEIQFFDTSTYDLDSFTALTTIGTNGADDLYGVYTDTDIDDTIYGLGGNDIIHANGGANIMDGGVGNDTLYGYTGNDVYIASPGFDTITEVNGTDTIILPEGYTMDDVSFLRHAGEASALEITIDGLGQIKIGSHFSSSANAVETIELYDTTSFNLSALSVETRGTSGNDTIYGITAGSSIDDMIDGRDGYDTLYGDAGDDTYFFSAGTDTLFETSGEDTIRFRDGIDPGDIMMYRGTAGASFDALILEDQNGNKIMAWAHFTLEGGSDHSDYEIENVVFADTTTWDPLAMEIETRGTSGNDTLGGATGGDLSDEDTIYGLDGADSISGGTGDDILDGGDGDDALNGQDDNDILYGGDGEDTLYGGAGEDIFVLEDVTAFNDVEQVMDFNSSDDTLDIADILDGYYTYGVDTLTDFLQITDSGSDSIVSIDQNGGGNSFVQVATLYGITGLTNEASLESSGVLVTH
jgi:Ca2+-binding RTX toxin-like protein